ncbi:MAG: hypothetical protein PHN83_05030 [Dysgonamonadaceae bacterium]|nr:hypothetical protein [Dysgonamonadaceae bacterium]
MKTDSDFLYRYMKTVIKENGLEVLFDTHDLYHFGINDKKRHIQTSL